MMYGRIKVEELIASGKFRAEGSGSLERGFDRTIKGEY